MNVLGLSEQYCHFFDEDRFQHTEREGFRRRVIRTAAAGTW